MENKSEQYIRYSEMVAVMEYAVANILKEEFPDDMDEKIVHSSERCVQAVLRCLR